MEAQQTIPIQLKLRKVELAEMVVPTSLEQETKEPDFFLALRTNAKFEIYEGRIDVIFTITGSKIEQVESPNAGVEVFRAVVKCETEIGVNDKPIADGAIPLLDRAIFQMLVREAFATTRGVLVGALKDSSLSSLLLPYSDPDTFLQDDIAEMLRTKKCVGTPKNSD